MAGAGRNPHQYDLVLKDWDYERSPMSLLFSFAYHDDITKLFKDGHHKKATRLILDSGAYTAFSTGSEIDLDAYMEFIHSKHGQRFDEVVGLDVIDDPDRGRLTFRNCMEMKRNGIECIPVFHYGDDEKWLVKYSKNFEKVGLSITSSMRVSDRYNFLRWAFQQVYPHKFHMFGWASKTLLSQFPFHSADTTSYMATGFRYGSWSAFHNMKGVCKVRKQDAFRMSIHEILRGLKVEREIQAQWSMEIDRQQTAWRLKNAK